MPEDGPLDTVLFTDDIIVIEIIRLDTIILTVDSVIEDILILLRRISTNINLWNISYVAYWLTVISIARWEW